MPIPPHSLHIYQKPKQGNDFLKRYPVFNYRHSINAVGWFDTASCEIAVRSIKEGEIFLQDYIGNRVAFFVDNPMEPIWEGMISRIAFQIGTVTFTNSMDDMCNRLALTYQNPTIAAPQTITSTYIDNLASQAIYGIKESILQLNVNPDTSTTRRTAIRALKLAIRAWPLTSAVFNSTGQRGLLKVEMRGFYQTLDWDHYNSAVTTEPNANVLVQEVVQGNINGSTFFDDTDASLMDSNVSFVAKRLSQTGLTRWQMLQTIQEGGDGGNRWIMGVTPTDPNLGTRRFYYRKALDAVTDIRYIVRQTDGMGVIRNIYGQKVDPWRVTPDGRIRLNDALVGWDLQGDDPRVSYLASIQYDAERQSIAWQSEDNITFDGIFRTSSYYNPLETTAGVGHAPSRQTYV